MRTHVQFLSDEFTACPGEEEEVNPGRWGKRLADYLAEELQKRGVGTGEAYAEDWGWAVPIENDAFPVWLGCGNLDDVAEGFLVFIEPSKPRIRKGLFKKIDTTETVERIAGHLDAVLRNNPHVRALEWWPDSGA